MRLVRWLAFLTVLAYQQFLLYRERQRVARLSSAIERHYQEKHLNKVTLVPQCVMPTIIDPPQVDLGRLRLHEN